MRRRCIRWSRVKFDFVDDLVVSLELLTKQAASNNVKICVLAPDDMNILGCCESSVGGSMYLSLLHSTKVRLGTSKLSFSLVDPALVNHTRRNIKNAASEFNNLFTSYRRYPRTADARTCRPSKACGGNAISRLVPAELSSFSTSSQVGLGRPTIRQKFQSPILIPRTHLISRTSLSRKKSL